MWPDLIRKAKEGGIDVIETYVFWDGHEPAPGQVTYFTVSLGLSLKSLLYLRLSVFCLFVYSIILRRGMIL